MFNLVIRSIVISLAFTINFLSKNAEGVTTETNSKRARTFKHPIPNEIISPWGFNIASVRGGSRPDEDSLSTENENRVEASSAGQEYEHINDVLGYSRWRSIIQRTVRMPNGKVIDFDVVDQKGKGAVVVFAWNTRTKTATLIREYMPGSMKVMTGVAAGIIESGAKHNGGDPAVAAKFELEEECHLRGGRWYSLTETDATVPHDKYSVTEFSAYIVLDAERIDVEGGEEVRELDEEENIEIIHGVSVQEILRIIRAGEMNLVGGWTCLLALEKLRELGEV
mmetsp:Transcript_419/g.967  ORF Transcript_419/g.967 Transcript_419/m.967 type:complete len:281 (-) Transcript_419:94-936(-)